MLGSIHFFTTEAQRRNKERRGLQRVWGKVIFFYHRDTKKAQRAQRLRFPSTTLKMHAVQCERQRFFLFCNQPRPSHFSLKCFLWPISPKKQDSLLQVYSIIRANVLEPFVPSWCLCGKKSHRTRRSHNEHQCVISPVCRV